MLGDLPFVGSMKRWRCCAAVRALKVVLEPILRAARTTGTNHPLLGRMGLALVAPTDLTGVLVEVGPHLIPLFAHLGTLRESLDLQNSLSWHKTHSRLCVARPFTRTLAGIGIHFWNRCWHLSLCTGQGIIPRSSLGQMHSTPHFSAPLSIRTACCPQCPLGRMHNLPRGLVSAQEPGFTIVMVYEPPDESIRLFPLARRLESICRPAIRRSASWFSSSTPLHRHARCISFPRT